MKFCKEAILRSKISCISAVHAAGNDFNWSYLSTGTLVHSGAFIARRSFIF